jgi:hypothetical protein
VSCADFTALSRYCTALQTLVLLEGCSRAGGASDLSAFRSLAHLQHLTHLELAPLNDDELVAFTSAAAAVITPRLSCLQVQGELTLHALMQLQSVCVLRELHAHVSGKVSVWPTFTVGAVCMWLVGLVLVPKVYLVVRMPALPEVVEATRRWASEGNMPLPAVLKVSDAW